METLLAAMFWWFLFVVVVVVKRGLFLCVSVFWANFDGCRYVFEPVYV